LEVEVEVDTENLTLAVTGAGVEALVD